MLGFVKGENNSVVFLDYMKKANDSAYHAIGLGANDSDTFTWCVDTTIYHFYWSLLIICPISHKLTMNPVALIFVCRTGIIDGILGQKSSDVRVQLATGYRFKVQN